MTKAPKVRKRLPYASLVGIVLVVLMTLGNAAANMMPMHLPTTREIQRAEQDELAQARRDRISALQTQGDQCRASVARELARELFFDGRSAAPYADNYAARCGDDPIVRHYADASAKLHLRQQR
jgi:hypothetical protein